MGTKQEQDKVVDINTAVERTDRSHEDYRKSGLGIMATVIGLSSGAMYLNKDDPFAYLFFVVIGLSLVQQLNHYLGGKFQARAHYEVLENLVQRGDSQEQAGPHFQKFDDLWKKATRHFDKADDLCKWSIYIFLILGAFGIFKKWGICTLLIQFCQ